MPGDIVQLAKASELEPALKGGFQAAFGSLSPIGLGHSNGHFYHSPVITAASPEILVAAHTFDALDRPLNSYIFDTARFIHIDGVRTW